jgi:hypothetical protein
VRIELLRVGELRIAVTDVRGQFGNPNEGERPPLEAVTTGLVKAQLTENI